MVYGLRISYNIHLYSMNAMMLLRMYNTLYNGFHTCCTNVSYIWETLRNAYSQKVYLLFSGISAPYLKESVNVGTPSSAIPLWYYEKDTKMFVEWTRAHATMEKTKPNLHVSRLPILSMAVMYEERVVHDLTDFLENVEVFHANITMFPSIAHILGAWSLSSKIVLNPEHEYTVDIITDTGDTLSVGTHSYAFFRPAEAETDGSKERA